MSAKWESNYVYAFHCEGDVQKPFIYWCVLKYGPLFLSTKLYQTKDVGYLFIVFRNVVVEKMVFKFFIPYLLQFLEHAPVAEQLCFEK